MSIESLARASRAQRVRHLVVKHSVSCSEHDLPRAEPRTAAPDSQQRKPAHFPRSILLEWSKSHMHGESGM